jgi:NAD(P)-dependent dehydrogenase (short-subunit alcohol dehydrogenase family)
LHSDKPFNAIVFGAAGGVGGAIADQLRRDERCKTLVALSRRADDVDLTNEESVKAAAQEIGATHDAFDLIINAAGVLEVDGVGPEKAMREINPERMTRAFISNAVGGAVFLKHFLPLLAHDRRVVFATLSARVGSIGDNVLGGWMSYRASKAALNQIIRCAAIEEKRRNTESIVVALHPGTIETPLTEKYARGRYTATREEAAANLLSVCASRDPEHSGGFFDYAGKEIAW